MVSVAKTALQSPRSKSSSMRRFTLGRIPAWWSPTPISRPLKIVWLNGDSPMVGLSCTASLIARDTSCCWGRESSGLPSA
jgi:hypothetical protein